MTFVRSSWFVGACAIVAALGCSATGSGAGDPSVDDGAPLDDATQPPEDGSRPPTDGTVPPIDGTTPPTDAVPPPKDGAPPPTDSTPPPPTDSGGPPPVDSGPPIIKPVCTTYVPPALGMCASERWPVKVGTDSAACTIDLTPSLTTIGDLRALKAPGTYPTSSRIAPTEETVFLLRDVTLVEYKQETDLDYHLVIQDSTGRTMIAEIPDPGCLPSSGPWYSMVQAVRTAFNAKFPVSSSFRTVSATVSLKGIGFFDVMHGQTGVAPNGIELHPVIGFCTGAGCTP